MKNKFAKTLLLATPLVTPLAMADIPPGYYDSVDDSSPQTLRDSLHEIIDDHQRFPYTSD